MSITLICVEWLKLGAYAIPDVAINSSLLFTMIIPVCLLYREIIHVFFFIPFKSKKKKQWNKQQTKVTEKQKQRNRQKNKQKTGDKNRHTLKTDKHTYLPSTHGSLYIFLFSSYGSSGKLSALFLKDRSSALQTSPNHWDILTQVLAVIWEICPCPSR